ncbi:metalloendopeptidase OMA1, mitochondrial-like [Ornithodoros turicata]|uniref:metalloendopeptidase OMA1, mitochondrial-like n=1 Tax=Ornithodoros turicata TaxID=34597 RepID=UPI0031395AFD
MQPATLVFYWLRYVFYVLSEPDCILLWLPFALGYRFIHCFRLRRRKISSKRILILPVATVGLFVCYYVSHLEWCPIANRSRFIAFTPREFLERISGDVSAIQKYFWKAASRPGHQRNYRRLYRTARKILRANRHLPGVKNKTWSFTIVRSVTPSAFVLPNCKTYVFDAIFDVCDTDDSLSFVLAHELTHCLLEHTLEKESLSLLLDKITSSLWAISFLVVRDDALALIIPWVLQKATHYGVFLPHSRFMELESDKLALQMTARSCYDFRYSVVYFDRTHEFLSKA